VEKQSNDSKRSQAFLTILVSNIGGYFFQRQAWGKCLLLLIRKEIDSFTVVILTHWNYAT